MPFTSKKQKKTIDAAAHNPEFAKKVGIKTSVAKKMSAHGKGQTKFKEATDTVEKDEKGNVKSWKHEGDWKKAEPKQGRGKVTNLSDKARRKTEKMSKPEKEMAEAFETALEGSIRGGVWTSQPPDKGQKDVPPPQEVDGGILNKKQPKPVNAPRGTKKAEIEQPTQVAATGDDEQMAEGKTKSYSAKKAAAGKDIGKPGKNFEKIAKSAEKGGAKSGKAVAGAVLKKLRAKQLAESIQYLGELIAEAKQATKSKCTCSTNEDKCKVHSKMKEGKGSKPDFLDMDKDGDKKEPMKKAVADKKAGPKKGVNPFAKKEESVEEGVAGPEKCWPGHKKVGTQPGTGKNKGKRVNDCEKIKEATKPLKGGQKKLDTDKDGDIDAKDMANLRSKKKAVKESTDLYMESLYQKLQNQLNG